MKVARKIGLYFIMLGLLTLSGCSVLNQVQSFNRFVNGKFKVEKVTIQNIGGIAPDQLNHLNFTAALQIANQLLNHSLKGTLVLKLNVTNPYNEEASVSGLQWEILQKGQVIATGQLNEPVKVEAKGYANFDINAEVNVVEILKLNSLDQIIQLVSRKPDINTIQKLGLSIRVKPWYSMGGTIQRFPGYINIKIGS
ncbi:MAG: LEA type 2 family protein [Bacteroidales bacterium]|nr:LEA type 2 family protein [Bacteroidales bacterium]